jgi:DNA-binding MarR family transcriptional regulator
MTEMHSHNDDAARLRSAIRALVRRFSVSERADVECCGLTVAQAATLEALQATPGMRLSDLGRRLGITPSTLTRNLARLEAEGLVGRIPDPEDGRASQVALTATGLGAAEGVGKQGVDFAAEVLARLPEGDRGAAVAAIERLLEAVREATEDCCPGAFVHLMKDFARDKARAGRSDDGGEGGCAC